MMINGEKMPELLMSVIRFVVPQKDHTLKKLLILYWDVVEKKNAQGQLLSEFILVWYQILFLMSIGCSLYLAMRFETTSLIPTSTFAVQH